MTNSVSKRTAVRIRSGRYKGREGRVTLIDSKGLYQVAFEGETKKPWFVLSQLELCESKS